MKLVNIIYKLIRLFIVSIVTLSINTIAYYATKSFDKIIIEPAIISNNNTEVPNDNRIRKIIGELPHHSFKKFNVRDKSTIKYIVLHHSSNDESIITDANYHINHNNWPGIGYHYVIDKDGTIYQVNWLTKITYHTMGYNRYSIGICFLGNYSIKSLNEKQIEAGQYLIHYLQHTLNIQQIYLHGELNNTECPGTNFQAKYFR